MKKISFRLLFIVAFIVVIGLTIISLNLIAAAGGSECTNGIQTCKGECCVATPFDCKAGPCNVIFPQQ